MNKILGDYILKEQLGAGQFGAVHHAFNIKTNEEFAIKIINISKMHTYPRMLTLINNEMDVLSKINNPNIIKLKEFIQSSNNFYFVYEYCNDGTLEEYINKKQYLTEHEALSFFQQIINGFKSLFLNKVLHRDFKPANILLHNGIIKIADFGFCKPLENQMDLTQTMVGSPIYMAPEILKGEDYNMKADIWSMGVVLFEMLFGFCPYEDRTIYRLLNQINLKPLIIPKHINIISKKTEELLFKMLVVDPKLRIEWNELINMKLSDFLKDLELEKIDSNGEAKTSRTISFNENNNLKNFNETYKSDLRFFLKERNKSLFILKTIENVISIESFCFLEKNEKNTIINSLFEICLKNYEIMIGEMIILTKNQEHVSLEDEGNLSELKVFMQTVKHEKSELESILKLFQLENKIPIFPNDRILMKIMIEKIFFNFKIQKDNDVQSMRNDLIISNLLVDCFQMNDIFSMFFEKDSKFLDQPYLKSFENKRNEDLLNMFIKKKNQIQWE